jgi:hypothetical protein
VRIQPKSWGTLNEGGKASEDVGGGEEVAGEGHRSPDQWSEMLTIAIGMDGPGRRQFLNYGRCADGLEDGELRPEDVKEPSHDCTWDQGLVQRWGC